MQKQEQGQLPPPCRKNGGKGRAPEKNKCKSKGKVNYPSSEQIASHLNAAK